MTSLGPSELFPEPAGSTGSMMRGVDCRGYSFLTGSSESMIRGVKTRGESCSDSFEDFKLFDLFLVSILGVSRLGLNLTKSLDLEGVSCSAEDLGVRESSFESVSELSSAERFGLEGREMLDGREELEERGDVIDLLLDLKRRSMFRRSRPLPDRLRRDPDEDFFIETLPEPFLGVVEAEFEADVSLEEPEVEVEEEEIDLGGLSMHPISAKNLPISSAPVLLAYLTAVCPPNSIALHSSPASSMESSKN